jgi:hypothetical protein
MQRLLPARAAAGPLTLEVCKYYAAASLPVANTAASSGLGCTFLQVLEGLDAFVHTERFLHKLDQARKELDEADADHATHLQQLAATGRTESLPVVEVQEDEFLDCTSATDRAASMPAVLEVSSSGQDVTQAPVLCLPQPPALVLSQLGRHHHLYLLYLSPAAHT